MLTIEKIFHAREVLKEAAIETDVLRASKIFCDNHIYLKAENLQNTGSFKLRGAYYKISQLSDEEKNHEEFKIYDNAGTERTKPCLIVVDVNGERKPNPQKKLAGAYQPYKVPKPAANARILDVFTIMVTDKNAVPYGVVGQKAMFQHN